MLMEGLGLLLIATVTPCACSISRSASGARAPRKGRHRHALERRGLRERFRGGRWVPVFLSYMRVIYLSESWCWNGLHVAH